MNIMYGGIVKRVSEKGNCNLQEEHWLFEKGCLGT